MKIEMIYFKGCPNVGKARENLKKALDDSGAPAEWAEWEQSDNNAPDYAQQYGSPTILVNGKDIMGGPGDCCAPDSCRIYEGGAPSVEMIKSAIKIG